MILICCLAYITSSIYCAPGFELNLLGNKLSSENLYAIHKDESIISRKFGISNHICSGVNIHFVKGHENELDMIAAAGFKFIRMDFHWDATERMKGNFTWTDYDELTTNLEKRGLHAIYILDYSNSLYEESVLSKDPITSKEQKATASPKKHESIAAFARWAAAAVEHYKNKNIIWEIWNEPNISFWKPTPDVEQYNALAIATCKAIKNTEPNAIIIGPGSAGIPFTFLEKFMASDILKYLDAVSVHPYRNLKPETTDINYNKLEGLIKRFAPSSKKIPIISSECGYSTSTNANGVSLETQAAYIVRMQLINLLNGVPISIWYDWKNDGIDLNEREHNFGTVLPDLKEKLAYKAIQTMNLQLKDFSIISRLITDNKNDYVLLFKNSKRIYKIVSWTIDEDHSITIDNKILKKTTLKAINGMGNSIKVNKVIKNKIVLNLYALPEYIEI